MFLSFAHLILPLFNILFPPNVPQRPISQTLTFRLRHFHAVTPSAHVYFADASSLSTLNADTQPLSISTAPVRTARPISATAFSEARALSMRAQSVALDWEDHEIPGPDVSKRETLLLLAKMTSNAYVEPDTDAWYNLTDEWGVVRPLGSFAMHLQLILGRCTF
jgi:lipase ATG15